MKRQLNYTGRKRLPHSMFRIQLRNSGTGAPTFAAELDFENARVPEDSRVFVEAFYKQSVMRFDFGTVANPAAPADTTLNELDARDRIQFRIKVVEDEVGGRILAAADKIRAEIADEQIPAGKESLLPVEFSSQLGEVLWRLHYEDLAGPVLELNATVPGIRDSARAHPAFFAFIYPTIVTHVLERIVLSDDYDPEAETSEGWEGKWLRFAQQLGQNEPPSADAAEEEKNAWVAETTLTFAKHTRALSRFIEWQQGGDHAA